MARDPLRILLRLRHQEVDSARAALVACEARAQEAQQAVQAAEAAIVSEMMAAARLAADDAVVEAFGAWLPIGRAAVARASAAQAQAEAAATRARAVLNLARAAAEAVAQQIEQREMAKAQDGLRREQAVLDEAGQRGGRQG